MISEKELTDINHKSLKKTVGVYEKQLTNSDGKMYLAVEFLIEINNIITSSNNITLRKANTRPYRFNKM